MLAASLSAIPFAIFVILLLLKFASAEKLAGPMMLTDVPTSSSKPLRQPVPRAVGSFMFPKPLSVLLLVKENAQVLYPADWHSIGVVPPLPYAVPAVLVIHAMKEHFNNNCDRRRVIK